MEKKNEFGSNENYLSKILSREMTKIMAGLAVLA